MDDGVDRDRWNSVHRMGAPPVLTRIRRATITGAMPPGIEPTTIWPSRPLDKVAAALEVGPGDTLVDLGCGAGAISVWLADHTGAEVVGVDPSIEGLQRARERAGGRDDVRFVEGHFEATGLDDEVADAVVAVDSLHFARDLTVALREVARVLRPGGRFVLAGAIRQVFDVESCSAAAGLRVLQRDETVGWQDRMRAFRDALVANEGALRADVGDLATDNLLATPIDEAIAGSWHGVVVAVRDEAPA